MTATPYPVDSYREAAPLLRRPFTPAAVKFKVQSTWGNPPTGGLVVSYIDARLVVERLNLVCPHLWHDEVLPMPGGGFMCRLTVDGLTRHDIGEGQGKAGFSDALKRAAVKFGIGVSLYAIPQSFIDVQNGSAKEKKGKLVMTPNGEREVRGRYRQWLESTGIQAFGQPLDHGDVDDGQGDTEVDPAAEPEPAPPEPEAPLATVQQERIFAAFSTAGVGIEPFLADVGAASLSHVTATHARALRARLDEVTSNVAAEEAPA